MRFGVCTGIEQAIVAQKAGFDYIECTVDSLKPEMSDDSFQEILNQYMNSPLPVEAFNIFIPKDLKITGLNVDYDRMTRYLEKALERVKKVGGETIVFGSGGARTVADGYPTDQAEEQIIKFLHLAADYAEPLKLTIVIEPLYKKASNIINNIPEAVDIAKKVNRKSIRVLADFFHMVEENDPLNHIVKYQEYIGHIHTSDNYLPPGTGQYPYPAFVDCLRKANYDGRISVECIWNDFVKEAVESREFLKQQFG